MPDRNSSGTMSHAANMPVMKAASSCNASGNWPNGIISSGSM
jgi:hypothetical protein